MSRFVVIEMAPDASENRPLGKSGEFLSGTYGESDIKEFSTPEGARQAGEQAANRRAGLTLRVPGERKAAARDVPQKWRDEAAEHLAVRPDAQV